MGFEFIRIKDKDGLVLGDDDERQRIIPAPSQRASITASCRVRTLVREFPEIAVRSGHESR